MENELHPDFSPDDFFPVARASALHIFIGLHNIMKTSAFIFDNSNS